MFAPKDYKVISNMHKKKLSKKEFISDIPSAKILIRKINLFKWNGCVYFAYSDTKEEAVLTIESALRNLKKGVLNNPVIVATAPTKKGVESKIIYKLEELVKSN